MPAPIEPVNNLPLGKYEVTLKPTEKTRSAAEGCPVPLEVRIVGRAGEAELTIQPGAQSVQNGFIVASVAAQAVGGTVCTRTHTHNTYSLDLDAKLRQEHIFSSLVVQRTA